MALRWRSYAHLSAILTARPAMCLTVCLAASSLVACDSGGSAGPADAGVTADAAPPAPEQIAVELGITRYVGAIEPIEESRDGDVTTYGFDPAEGPVCMRGAPFRASVRDVGADDLVIFLQGGGACWSAFCLAVVGAPAGVPAVDVLDTTLEANPVRAWNQVYLPYCDGSFFSGDAAHDDDLNGKGRREHRGLANLTGALEVARARFPAPRRILLAGSSGGAYGLLLAGPLVRHYYPEAELIMMADSGIGLARDGDAGSIDTILDEFAVGDFLPSDCPECKARGHITGLIGWYLARDPNVRVGMYSAWYDAVLANTFLQVEPSSFAAALERESRALHAAWPDRFRRFIADGTQHTSLLGDPSGVIGSDFSAVELPPGALQRLIGGDLVIRGMTETRIGELTMATWLTGLVEGDLEAWIDVEEPRGPAPPGPAGE